jgi:hypothetical protein
VSAPEDEDGGWGPADDEEADRQARRVDDEYWRRLDARWD